MDEDHKNRNFTSGGNLPPHCNGKSATCTSRSGGGYGILPTGNLQHRAQPFTRGSPEWPAIVPLIIMDEDGGDPGVVCIRSVHPLRLTGWRGEAWNLPPPKHTMNCGDGGDLGVVRCGVSMVAGQ